MEMSVLLPLLGNVAVHVARPFFPQDVADALAEAKAPRLLVTTPVHLRALVEAGVSLPPMAGIVTATAPLPQPLAAAAEARFGCEVREVFGSTETCIIARRRTALEDRSEEHTSELQSLMRISYAVFCLKKTKTTQITDRETIANTQN